MANRSREIKNLRSWHYVVYRSVKTGRRRKFDSRVKLYAEVYSKKSGTRVGYVNRVRENKPIPRKFSNKSRLIHHTGRIIKKPYKEVFHEKYFRINYSKWVEDQIPEWVPRVLNEQIDNKGLVIFKLRMLGKDNKGLLQDIFSESYGSSNEKKEKDWFDIVANLIVSALRGNQIRTSPKQYSKGNQYWRGGKTRKNKYIAEFHYIRKYRVELILRSH